MAPSPSHRLGQFLGNLLEALLLPELELFSKKYGIYVDRHGERPGVRSGKKATWVDKFGNAHDLDFVIEKGGSVTKQGRPLAFIEAAWRRYTKHSRNKAQEIQGAVLPMAETFAWDKPFLGAVLAGCFTKGSITQLQSLGFTVVYISYDDYVAAFASVGIDIRFDEETPDAWFDACLVLIAEGGKPLVDLVLKHLSDANRSQLDQFTTKLQLKLERHIEKVIIVSLFGQLHEFASVESALNFIGAHSPEVGKGAFRGYEVIVRYSNGDHVSGVFQAADEVQRFLAYAAN